MQPRVLQQMDLDHSDGANLRTDVITAKLGAASHIYLEILFSSASGLLSEWMCCDPIGA
jgi:hypothetical protein